MGLSAPRGAPLAAVPFWGGAAGGAQWGAAAVGGGRTDGRTDGAQRPELSAWPEPH